MKRRAERDLSFAGDAAASCAGARADALRAAASSSGGLSSREAASRLTRDGPNRLPRKPATPLWLFTLRQFQSPLIYILLAAAALSLAIGEARDAGFIAVVLSANAAIGAWQESKAERHTRALQSLLQIRAVVLRDGDWIEIDAEHVVCGDVVWLESGARVPADCRLLKSRGCEIDESLLTGESLPVAKDPEWIGVGDEPLAEQRNMALAGTSVVRGRAEGLVVATGSRSAVGRLARDVLEAPPGRPPLMARLERLSRAIGFGLLTASATIGVYGVVILQEPVLPMLLVAVALAVAAVPEGLPVALTITLAVATTRMARRGVIVRRLAAVEGLGSCTYIASDKTGTLTCNQMTVREIQLTDGQTLHVSGEGFEPSGGIERDGLPVSRDESPALEALLRAAVLCNEAELHRRDDRWVWRGDPTDVALLTVARKAGMERAAELLEWQPVAAVPFEPERRYAAAVHGDGDAARIFVKGAAERVLGMCAWPDEARALWHAHAERMGQRGLRVLALAEAPARDTPGDVPAGLSFLGLVGMLDPLRPGAADAIRICLAQHIHVAMVTGDHPVTALAIARQLDLAHDARQVVTGEQLEHCDERQLEQHVSSARVFARMAPHQKLDLVRAAQNAGHFVAVTGDGVNDAPALRAANIGVAMGRGGTDVARESADLVLTDDHFATTVAGIAEGRAAYDNIRKVVLLLISTGVAEVLLIAASLAAGLPLPLLPVQLLWLNLVTNGLQDVALAFEPPEPDVLTRGPRRPSEPIFNRLMIEQTVVSGAVMAGVATVTFAALLAAGRSEESARNAVLLLMVLFENVHIGNCRSESRSALAVSPLVNPLLMLVVAVTQLLHVAALYLPLGHSVLRTQPVTPVEWALLLTLALSVLAAMELQKALWRARRVARVTPP